MAARNRTLMAQLVTVQLIQRIFCKESKSLGKYLKCVASNLLHGACTNYKVKVAMKNYLFFNEKCEEKKDNFNIQQGLEIHGLEECGPWRCTVFNWFPKHLRYTDLGQKP